MNYFDHTNLSTTAAVASRRDELLTEARSLTEAGDLAGPTLERFEAITSEVEALTERHALLVRAEVALAQGALESSDSIRGMAEGSPQLMRRVDPYGDSGDIRSRALAAIDQTRAEDVGRVVEVLDRQDDENVPAFARQMLAQADPAYLSGFRRWVRDPQGAAMSLSDRERHAWAEAEHVRTSLQLGNTGAALIPLTLDPSIRLTNNGATNPVRALADVRTTLTNTWQGVTSQGVTAEWKAEATEVSDATPTLSEASITVHAADAYLQASWEVVQDSNFADDVSRLVADAKDRLEAAAFITGTGSGQPYGIVTRLAATTASRVAGSSGSAGAADLVAADIYAVDNALPDRYRGNAAWLGNKVTYNAVRQLGTQANPHAFWTDIGGGRPAELIGYPTHEASSMDSTIVSGSNDDVLVLGDFSQGFVIADRIGMSLAVNNWVLGSNRRPTGEVGYAAFWRVGSDLVDTNAARLLRL